MELKKQVLNIFKLNGLTLRSDSAQHLAELLEPINADEHDKWIDRIIESVQKLPLSSLVIKKEDIEAAVSDITSSEYDDISTFLQAIDIYSVPKLVYSYERKKFLVENPKPLLYGEADDKALLFKNRYAIVYHRTMNHNIFSSMTGSVNADSKGYGLVKVEFLLGLSSRQDNLIVLGLLTQVVEGEYHLEDDTGLVKVDLSETKFHTGLFTLNCFVLLEGWADERVLHANAIGLPPTEDPVKTRALLGNNNYFGGPKATCAKYCNQLIEAEQLAVGAMIVFISDLWLDKFQVLAKLGTLFKGFTSTPPMAFVFCGNFLSTTHRPSEISDLKLGFTALADLIADNPGLSSTRFIFVPGPNDPGPTNVYPRPPIPLSIRKEFEERIPNSEFVSNPCRLLFFTQEIVIFREDIFTKMCRNAIYVPPDASNIASHFARTLVSQAHLCPVPLHAVPIFWTFDHCLSLHPTPDVIVTADRGKPFVTNYNSAAVVMNPGSFMRTNFSFKVYIPSTKSVEDSQVDDE